MKIYVKVLVTGHIFEVYTYEKLNINGGGKKEGNGEFSDQNYQQTQRLRRASIRQLIAANFDNRSKFVTLTFDNNRPFDITNVQACNSYFKRFILRLRYRYPDLKYTAVIEFQDLNGRGAVHYHMICNLPYIKKSQLSDIWAGGFVKINKIDKVDNVGAYVVKYMNKDIEDERLRGENAYLHSKGLDKPLQFRSWKRSDSESLYAIEDLIKEMEPTYSHKYESSQAGEITYCQYNLHRENGQGEKL